MKFKSHDDYFSAQGEEYRYRLEQIQTTVEALVPEAQRTISYNMPAFKLGRIFLYFAFFKNHIGIYPPVKGDSTIIELTAAYRGPKGNLSFQHGEELPLQVIAMVATALAAQYGSR